MNTYAGADYFHINYVPIGSGTVTVKNESVSIDIGTYGPIYGSTAETFTGATFQGWYHDEACTGEPLSTEPAFIPEMPADGWQSGKTYTYYAKFEETDASLQYVIVDPAGNKFNEDQSWAKLSSYSESVDVISGQVTGSTATVLDNAYKFVGWYATADCTGTPLSTDAHYTPTKSSELWTSATYYAKFEYNLTSLKIQKQGHDPIDENQTFLFRITDEEGFELMEGLEIKTDHNSAELYMNECFPFWRVVSETGCLISSFFCSKEKQRAFLENEGITVVQVGEQERFHIEDYDYRRFNINNVKIAVLKTDKQLLDQFNSLLKTEDITIKIVFK